MDKFSKDRRYGRTIQGQLLRLSVRREVAIYLRDGRLWIADFVDGEGELIEPTTWFRFNCATPAARQGRRRMLLESAVPLSAELLARIERLHRALLETQPDQRRSEQRMRG